MHRPCSKTSAVAEAEDMKSSGSLPTRIPREEQDPQAPWLGYVSQLDSVIAEHRPDLVVLTGRDEPQGTFSRLLDAAQAGFRVVQLTEFYEYAFGRVPIEDLPHDWFMSVLHLYQRRYSRASQACPRPRGRLFASAPHVAALPATRGVRSANGRPRDLASGSARRARKAVHDLQVPDDACGCRSVRNRPCGRSRMIRG